MCKGFIPYVFPVFPAILAKKEPLSETQEWNWEIAADKPASFSQELKECWQYRHLLGRLVRRDFLLNYQQTLIGPLWIVLQPLLTLLVYSIIFGRVLQLSTGSLPPLLFYLSGIILWNLFSENFAGNSSVFVQQAELFKKIYFPRLVIPLAQMITHVARFGIQFIGFLACLIYYWSNGTVTPAGGLSWLLAPWLVLMLAMASLALGLLFSVLTARYRDLTNLVHLGIRLLMFITPVVYPRSVVPEKWRFLMDLNPLVPFFEGFRYVFLGEGEVQLQGIAISSAVILVITALAAHWYQLRAVKLMDVV